LFVLVAVILVQLVPLAPVLLLYGEGEAEALGPLVAYLAIELVSLAGEPVDALLELAYVVLL